MKQIAPRIVVDNRILGGKPVIKGTRVPVYVLVGHMAAGDSAADVAKEYRLTRADVLAALQYAARILSDEVVAVLG